MFQYEQQIKLGLQDILTSQTYPDLDSPELEKLLEDKLRLASENGKLHIPKSISSHSMRLHFAIKDLKSKSENYYLSSLIQWMAKAHNQDVYFEALKIKRENPSISFTNHLEKLTKYGLNAIDTGSFGENFVQDSDLVTSAWNGKRCELYFNNWTAHVKFCTTSGSLRLGKILKHVAVAPIPKSITVEFKFRTGKLFIGSETPLKTLNDILVHERQKNDLKGLQGQLHATETILDNYQVVAIPVHQRSLSVLSRDNNIALVFNNNVNKVLKTETSNILLDYRFLTVADEDSLIESQRTNFKQTKEELTELYHQQKDVSNCIEIQVEPGVYKVTMPANYAHELPERINFEQSKNAVLTLEKV
jgi:hypothetical protein